MTFLNPLGFLIAIGFPIVYFLSRNNKEKISSVVPSIEIWRMIEEKFESKDSSKRWPSLLLILRILAVGLCLFGALDIYFLDSAGGEVVTLIVDTSISTERIFNDEDIKNFIRGNSKSNFKIFFVDDKIREFDSLFSSKAAIDLIEKRKISRKPLNMEIFNGLIEREKSLGENIVVFSDKKIKGDYSIKILDFDSNNTGIRKVSYDKISGEAEIVIENDHKDKVILPMELSENGTVIFSQDIFIEGNGSFIKRIPLKGEESISTLDVKIMEDDSLTFDNQYRIPILRIVDLNYEDPSPQLIKVLSLIPYARVSSFGAENTNFENEIFSDVEYEEGFLNEVRNGKLFSDETAKSPFFPLWIEDHVNFLYEKEYEEQLKLIMANNPPYSYMSFDYGGNAKFSVEEDNIIISGFVANSLLIILFIILLVAEEEVRKRA